MIQRLAGVAFLVTAVVITYRGVRGSGLVADPYFWIAFWKTAWVMFNIALVVSLVFVGLALLFNRQE
jgi:ABC-type Fe3+ transport system permease subunit